jgi:hypothetical protein
MSHTFAKRFLPENIDVLRADARACATAVRGALQALAQGAWQCARMMFNMPDELRRMADECESTNPEHAAQLRKAAQNYSGW